MRFINEHLYPLCAALLLVIGISSWFALPAPLQPKTLAATPEAWQLPTQPQSDTAKAIDTISGRNLWGIAASAAGGPPAAPPPPAWSVMGIARNGAERFILMAYEGKPIAQLKVGDTLPDGMKIAQIEDDRFFVLTAEKKKIVFGMYKNEPKQ